MGTSVFFLLMIVVGWAAQFVDGTLGMGYGVFSASLLVGIGLAPAIASASVHTAEIVSTLISGLSHHYLGNVKKATFLPLVIPGVIGAVSGAYVLASIPGKMIKPYVAVILVAMGCLVLYRFLRESGQQPREQLPSWRISLLGLVAGFLDALGGGGWGPVATPSLILSGNGHPNEVVGSVNLAEFFVTVAAAVTFFFTIGAENFNWTVVLAMLIGGAIAAPIGAWVCKRLTAGGRRTRRNPRAPGWKPRSPPR
ncbi:MAG: sulfite exporter TauE/SafE family protein [Chloroflexota bacterium]|nr:sulfite exporter TauE/SafE family protein [Chloroflexota bacterium]